MNDIKQQIVDAIESKVEFCYHSGQEYRIRCPICGDSPKSPRAAHCYIKCSYDPNEPLLYICFRCNSSGIVGKSFLEKLGIDQRLISKVTNVRYNRLQSAKSADVNILTGEPILGSPQIQYIESRLGTGLTVDDYDRFKIVWNMDSVVPYITDKRTLNTLPSNRDSITFLSDNKALLLTRTFDPGNHQWRKISMFPNGGKAFYVIKSTLNLFTREPVTVNIVEGVFDALSAYKNFNDGENSVFIATLGSDYASAVGYIIAKGIFGSNVTLKVFIDGDVDDKQVKWQLKKYRWIFNHIYMYRNILEKDIGVPIDRIRLSESKI